MYKRIGKFCLFLGLACLAGAIGLIAYNRWEDRYAQDASKDLLEKVQGVMEQPRSDPALPEEGVNFPGDLPTTPTEMGCVKVDGEDCIGVLFIPALNVELPVLKSWSYSKLKKAPCHYFGTYYEKNFVIAGHNYSSHFGKLPQLRPGDLVFFTDVNGKVYSYAVDLLETLPKEATGEMISGGFDLSLYTCTTGGEGRVTVRCTRVF